MLSNHVPLKKKRMAKTGNALFLLTVWSCHFALGVHIIEKCVSAKMCVRAHECAQFLTHTSTDSAHIVKQLFTHTNAPQQALSVSRAGLEGMTGFVLLCQKTSFTRKMPLSEFLLNYLYIPAQQYNQIVHISCHSMSTGLLHLTIFFKFKQ